MWSTIEIFLVILGASIPHLNPLLRWGKRLPSSCYSDDAHTDDTRSLELAEGNRSRGGGDDGGEGGGGGRAPNRSSARGFTRLGVPERVWSGAGGARGSGGRNQLSQSEENILAGLHGGSSDGFGEKKAGVGVSVGGGGDHDGDGDGRWDGEGRGALPRAWVS
jgi:hypothetical protein